MFKIVYVLTSKVGDYYYEQLMISLESLRNKMPQIDVVVVTDDLTYATLTGDRHQVFDFATVKKVEIDNRFNQKERSRYLKTSLRSIIQGDFLFIDCDTVICCDFSEHKIESVLAMSLDRNCKLSEWADEGKEIRRTAQRCNFDLRECDNYYNSGVMWVKECELTKRFFEEWHKYWEETLKIGMCVDQLSLNHVNTNIFPLIEELDGTWNCQVTLKPAGVEYIANSKIIHYFNTNPESPYMLCDESMIREGVNDQEVKKIISEPRSAFRKSYIVTMNSRLDNFMKTKQFKVLFKFYNKFSGLFELNEKILNLIQTILFGIKRNKNWERY